MKELGVKHVRLDERMIHGQVATMWVGKLGITRIMIVDDKVVYDELAKASLKTAVPAGVKLSILKTKTAAMRILEKKYLGQKVMVICKEINTIFELIKLGIPIASFNLGNSSNKGDLIQVTKSVFLSSEEIDKIKELEQLGVQITSQMVPMEESRSFSEFYKGGV